MTNVIVNTIVDEDAAAASVYVDFQGFTGKYTASSKRHPKDNVNKSLGEGLAVARALQKAVTDIRVWAEREMTTDEFMRLIGARDPFFKEPQPNAVSR